nr:non-functional pseudokinase ZED1-like isoform X4 [Ziziphus jujuba var. spinosa]
MRSVTLCFDTKTRVNYRLKLSYGVLIPPTKQALRVSQKGIICGWFVLSIRGIDRTSLSGSRDIAITSQMSSHNRVLKLIGCCLELPVPALVYEDNECVPLNPRGYISDNDSALPWKTRLRIAKDVANALTYLHTTFSTPIVHRNVKPSNVFLDKDLAPKLCNFYLSISIPKGETRVEDQVAGTEGFVDPEYYNTSFVTEQSDVYGFGVFLLVLLSGKSPFEFPDLTDFVQKKPWDEVVDPKILEEEGVIEEEHKLQALRNLVLRCIQTKADDRPMMIDVAKELLQIHRSTPSP